MLKFIFLKNMAIDIFKVIYIYMCVCVCGLHYISLDSAILEP